MRAVRSAACVGAALILFAAGCAIAPPRPPVDDPREAWNDRVQAMKGVDEWEIRGKLAVRTSKRGENINMFWVRRDRDNHKINLYGPMGAGRVLLMLDQHGAVLRDNKNETYQDDSAEDLLYRVAGWRVPFQSMQHWVLGVAAPGSGYDMELDHRGRLSTLTQNGWKIEITEYHYQDGRDMPRSMIMNALPGTEHIIGDESGESETIQVKAILKRWDWP